MQKVIWAVFYLDLLVIVVEVFGGLLGLSFAKSPIIQLLILLVPIILLFLHSIYTLGKVRGLFFIILASLVGLGSEVWALKTGTIFGGHYFYRPSGWMIYDVPLVVAFFWAVFIYVSYCVTTSFLYWLNKDKPSRNKKNILLLPLLVLLDGIFVVAIDLFMDPLQVKVGAWYWLKGGPYYDIPVGNFIGWFLVTAVVTGIYRIYEYFFSETTISINRRIFLVPVIGYATLSLSFAASAIEARLFSLVVTGSVLMLPTVIVNLFLFKSWTNTIVKRS